MPASEPSASADASSGVSMAKPMASTRISSSSSSSAAAARVDATGGSADAAAFRSVLLATATLPVAELLGLGRLHCRVVDAFLILQIADDAVAVGRVDRRLLLVLEVVGRTVDDAEGLVRQVGLDEPLGCLVVERQALVAQPVAGRRQELDVLLVGLGKVEELGMLEDGEVERRLLDAMVMALGQRHLDVVSPQLPDRRLLGHGEHARVQDG